MGPAAEVRVDPSLSKLMNKKNIAIVRNCLEGKVRVRSIRMVKLVSLVMLVRLVGLVKLVRMVGVVTS